MRTALAAVVAIIATGGIARTEVRLPTYSRQVLPNGAVLYLIPAQDVPMASIRVLVKGGAESVPADLPGLSSVTATLLRRGTAKRTGDEFSREVDSLGAGFYADSDDASTHIGIDFLRKDLDSALDLLVDAVAHPTFPQAEVSKMLGRRVEGARSLKDSPDAVAYLYHRAAFFGPGHPYGRPADELGYARMKREDIIGYHDRMYTGSNMIILAAGSFDIAADGKKIADLFGKIAKGEPYVWKSLEIPEQTGRTMVIVDKPDAKQTQIYMGVPGISRRDPDRIPLMLVNTVFGGRFTSVLNEALRVDEGLTYGASSFFQQTQLRGSLTIDTFTQTSTTAETVAKCIELVRTMREKGITAEQLASAKNYVKGTYPADHLETADQVASTIGELELFGMPASEVDNFFRRIDTVTLDQANTVARKYFREDQLRILLLGNAALFREGVAKYAPIVAQYSIMRPGIWLRR
jgi:predicted Zn-dependent peptidase